MMTPTTISPPSHVGDTVTLPATVTSEAEQVKLLRVVDPAQGADQFATPVGTGRFVAVQLQITDSGMSTTQEFPAFDTIVEDGRSTPYLPTSANVRNCPAFGTNPNISPGHSITGCVTFQLAASTPIADITFTPGGAQFGTVTAEWQLSSVPPALG